MNTGIGYIKLKISRKDATEEGVLKQSTIHLFDSNMAYNETDVFLHVVHELSNMKTAELNDRFTYRFPFKLK
jgi:hypothetical protein